MDHFDDALPYFKSHISNILDKAESAEEFLARKENLTLMAKGIWGRIFIDIFRKCSENKLRQALSHCIQSEEYELCAMIRDILKEKGINI